MSPGGLRKRDRERRLVVGEVGGEFGVRSIIAEQTELEVAVWTGRLRRDHTP